MQRLTTRRPMSHETLSFEKAFERLEQILSSMNSGKMPLEESLKLFEEAEKLMRLCGARLTSAEKKVEQLIKTRNGEIALDSIQKPQTEPFAQNVTKTHIDQLPF